MRLRPILLLGGLLLMVWPAPPTAAQERPPRPTIVVAPPVPDVPSPTGAFLRSLVVPGWGHAAIGSYGRASFYVAAASGTAYALIRTRLRLSEARERLALREGLLRDALAAEGVTGPELDARLDANPGLVDARGLVGARESQQEDWVALAIFLTLLGGADAYVSAHLANFPEPIQVGAVPGPTGGVELRIGIAAP